MLTYKDRVVDVIVERMLNRLSAHSHLPTVSITPWMNEFNRHYWNPVLAKLREKGHTIFCCSGEYYVDKGQHL